MTSDTDAIWLNRAKKAILLIRILVGWVFLSEGIQKFLFPETLGVGRFTRIGIPLPQLMAPFIGVTEIICGALLLTGLFTRLACVPLLIDICVALYSTKIVTFMKNGIVSMTMAFGGTRRDGHWSVDANGRLVTDASGSLEPLDATLNGDQLTIVIEGQRMTFTRTS